MYKRQFFDCIYVQDETGGINCFPVAGDFKIGDRVRVSGTTSSYQGEHQLAVTDIVKLGEGEAVTPREVTSTQVNDGSVLGQLITLKGYVVGIEMANGLVQTILVRDSAGAVSYTHLWWVRWCITTATPITALPASVPSFWRTSSAVRSTASRSMILSLIHI